MNEKNRSGQSYADALWQTADVPAQLWHYTDSAGLLGIATSRSLWCTEYRYLNDRQEMAIFATQLQGRLGETLKEFLSKEDVDRMVGLFLNFYTVFNVFVCSFCKEPDRNEHWQQYAGRAGYALGFDPHVLRSLAQAQGFMLAPLLYGTEIALSTASTVIQGQLSVLQSLKSPLATEDHQKLIGIICGLILGCAPFFKHASFKHEDEWRLVKVIGINDDEMLFRASKAFGLVNYYKFKFESEPGKIPTNLIPRVIIGPGNETVGLPRANNPYALLKKIGLTTLVGESESSLRFHD